MFGDSNFIQGWGLFPAGLDYDPKPTPSLNLTSCIVPSFRYSRCSNAFHSSHAQRPLPL